MSFRQTVDLSRFPDLVVIYLGMRATSWRGVPTVLSFGPRIQKAVDARPDGLLAHENLFYGFAPLHAGMRQYWRDLPSLEKWTRDSPHLDWWKSFHKDPRGTMFWHETYLMKGGIEAVYVAGGPPVGLQQFAPSVPARGPMLTARLRAQRDQPGQPASDSAPPELYPDR